MNFDTVLTEEIARRYKQAGWWVDRTIVQYFGEAVARTPGKTAVVAPNGRMTYSELAAQVNSATANLKARGINKGDVVSVQLPNWAEFIVVHLALSQLGAVTNPLLPNYRASELSYILKFARTVAAFITARYRNFDFPAMYAELWPELPDLKHIFVVGGHARGHMQAYDELQTVPLSSIDSGFCEPQSGDDISSLIFTSGTESKPKGVMHSHNTMMYGTLTMAKLLGLTSDDVVWMPSPVGHGTGFLWGVRQALTLGSKIVLQDAWDPEEALRLIEQERCTFTLSATPFAAMLVDSPSVGKRDLSSFRIFASAGAPIPRKLGIDARERLGCLLIGMWGMSECFVGSASAPTDGDDKLWGTDGTAMPGGELAIFDETRTRTLPPGETGELATRGPHVALGYFKDPERTRDTFSPDGWLFSNDLATMDAEGYIRIVGRKKDIINRGGLKISAREMEEMLLLHPLVKAAAIVGVPDARLGEKSCVFIIAKSDKAPALAELLAFLEERGVAKYKLPEYLVVVSSFPMTASGKIQKFVLRDGVADGSYTMQGA